MADEAFRHKFSSEKWVGDLFCARSLSLSLSLLFLSFFSLSFFQSLFLSPSFLAFPTDTCRQAHTSREPTSEKCNLSISAPQRKDKQCWKNEGINTLPTWCWTNMSRCLQFANGPATFSAHRCGNSRTNLIAPVAAVVVSGFVCLPCLSLYCLTDSLLEGCAPLKWQERDGCSYKARTRGISLHQMLSLEEKISKRRSQVDRPSCWSGRSGESSVSLRLFGLRDLLVKANLSVLFDQLTPALTFLVKSLQSFVSHESFSCAAKRQIKAFSDSS